MTVHDLRKEISQISSLACLLHEACDIGDETTGDLIEILLEKTQNIKEKLRG